MEDKLYKGTPELYIFFISKSISFIFLSAQLLEHLSNAQVNKVTHSDKYINSYLQSDILLRQCVSLMDIFLSVLHSTYTVLLY